MESVEQALHEKVDVLRRALTESKAGEGLALPVEDGTVAVAEVEEVVDDAKTCSRCDEQMVVRHRKADGAAFWGCSAFPRCRHTEPM